MAAFDDENDQGTGSQDEDENEDEEMEDVNETNHDDDQDMDAPGEEDDEYEGDGDDENGDDNENDEDEDEDNHEVETPSRRPSQPDFTGKAENTDDTGNPDVVSNSPSPRLSTAKSPGTTAIGLYVPPTRPEALTASAYDIVPTIAAPQSTSINAVAATPDMRWVFSGGTDGYVRMYNWVETANGKVPLTVAQKHPFVDSVMKAGSLVTYWENEESSAMKTPPSQPDEGKWTSPVYSLAVQHQATWLLSGLESGGINLQTCRHHAGTRITTLKEHTSAVCVLSLSLDETSLLSGSWDKNIFDWDLNAGKVKRSFRGSGSQISAIEIRPVSDMSIPEISDSRLDFGNDTFSSNNEEKPLPNGIFEDLPPSRLMKNGDGDEDAMGSPSGSLFGEGDHGSLFGDETVTAGAGGAFDEDDDDLVKALETEMQQANQDAGGTVDNDTTEIATGGPVLPPEPAAFASDLTSSGDITANANGVGDEVRNGTQQNMNLSKPEAILTNGLPHSDEPLTAPPTNEDQKPDLPPQSESTFLDASIDGTLRIWDRRVSVPVATIPPYGNTPPWCTGACWSPDGNFFYAGRRNCTVDEFSIHHLGSKRSEPNRVFKFQQGSGPVYAVRAMPNTKHLVCASLDILRIYDLKQAETRHKTVPFTIVPGHRGGVISAIYVDPTCRFMLSAAGNRGWEGTSTEVLLGYEIGVQDERGIWHR